MHTLISPDTAAAARDRLENDRDPCRGTNSSANVALSSSSLVLYYCTIHLYIYTFSFLCGSPEEEGGVPLGLRAPLQGRREAM